MAAQPGHLQRRRQLLRLAALSALPWAARPARAATAPAELGALLGPVRQQGRMQFRWFGLRIYEARLWVPESAPALTAERYAAGDFALELAYARTLDGAGIAERSLQEMRRVGRIEPAQESAWLAAMKSIFPDVQAGDRLVGHHRSASGVATFLFNGRPVGSVADAEFARLFFGIWLSTRSPEPALRAALLGTP
ncbi:chalcone isomerase-like protein [Sphaerotilus hippei]|uniref:Chalcone isomerase-like protein n=1 Tax=Sphaerotilus hippei TaxID=744406 RepID=A0A318GZM3_9BURK|nr:chalcone isomerase family protein [Sphaerotilus hippei]PXW95843.1 chalcone isomerase-like protein [Sphaerotilus hippei]